MSLSASDLDAIAAAYEPTASEAPIVVGHPAMNGPAYGWIEKLERNGDVLEAVPTQVDAAFADLVREGKFKKVSASFFKPDSPNNPKPGQFYLRHVGFLGAAAPAVKGLRDASFSEGESDLVSFAVDAAVAVTVDQGAVDAAKADAEKALVDALPSTLDQATKDAVTKACGDAIGKLADAILALAAGSTDGKAADAAAAADTNANLAEPAEVVERRAALDKRERELAERERAAKTREHVAFCEALVAKGKPLPCSQQHAVAFMSILDTADTSSVSFGEGEKRTPLELFKATLEAMPAVVNLSEVAGGAADGEVDTDPKAIAQKADAYRAEQASKGLHVSTTDAVKHVMRYRRTSTGA